MLYSVWLLFKSKKKNLGIEPYYYDISLYCELLTTWKNLRESRKRQTFDLRHFLQDCVYYKSSRVTVSVEIY